VQNTETEKEHSMSERAETLARQFEEASAELAAEIEKTPDEKWQTAHGPEGWTIAATAQHVAGQFPLESEYIFAAAEGKPMPTYSWDDINHKNDTRAAANTNATKAEVLDLLRKDTARMAEYVRNLTDNQLDRQAPLALADGAMVSTLQLIEGGVLIDHVRGHTKSIQEAR
jgi:uncharacterized damage-inducible protein DinB